MYEKLAESSLWDLWSDPAQTRLLPRTRDAQTGCCVICLGSRLLLQATRCPAARNRSGSPLVPTSSTTLPAPPHPAPSRHNAHPPWHALGLSIFIFIYLPTHCMTVWSMYIRVERHISQVVPNVCPNKVYSFTCNGFVFLISRNRRSMIVDIIDCS